MVDTYSNEWRQALPKETSRERVQEMLREIAYVLHLTRKVRDEIESEQDAEELVLA